MPKYERRAVGADMKIYGFGGYRRVVYKRVSVQALRTAWDRAHLRRGRIQGKHCQGANRAAQTALGVGRAAQHPNILLWSLNDACRL
jgi:hypothetical protein